MSRPETQELFGARLDEPWQAEVLALSIALQETGQIAPAEWSGALSEVLKDPATGDQSVGESRHGDIVVALERLLVEKGLLATEEIDQRQAEWEEAFRQTAHGQPVVIRKA